MSYNFLANNNVEVISLKYLRKYLNYAVIFIHVSHLKIKCGKTHYYFVLQVPI